MCTYNAIIGTSIYICIFQSSVFTHITCIQIHKEKYREKLSRRILFSVKQIQQNIQKTKSPMMTTI